MGAVTLGGCAGSHRSPFATPLGITACRNSRAGAAPRGSPSPTLGGCSHHPDAPHRCQLLVAGGPSSPASWEAQGPSRPMEPQQSKTESSVSSLFGEKEGISACPGSGPVSPLGFPAAPTQSGTGVRCRSWLAAACAMGAAFLEGSGLHASSFGERLGAAPARSARQECVLLRTGSLEPRFLRVPGIAGIFQRLTQTVELGRAAAGRAAGRAAG